MKSTILNVTKKDVINVYDSFKSYIFKKAETNDMSFFNDIETLVTWAYFFNFKYTDPDLENLLRIKSHSLFGVVNVDQNSENRFVIIDSNGQDNRGLTQQYLRALISLGKEIIYVYLNRNINGISDILKELNEYDKAKVVLFNEKNITNIEICKIIIEEIKINKPAGIFLLLMPWDYISVLVCNAIKGVDIYNVNLTDHGFWLGSSILDYNIEFRPYGRTVSLEKRGLDKKCLLNLPYYPIISKYETFNGFDGIPTDSIKILTGGGFYKMYGRNDLFFHIMDALLSLSPKIVIIIAGDGNRQVIRERIRRLKNRDRIYLIGNRHDIAGVFKNIDIYLGTFPFPGGLMSQYAAYFSKPIAAFGSHDLINTDIEGLINHRENHVKTFYNISDILKYVSKLVEDVNFRISEGEKAKKSLMEKKTFETELDSLLKTKINSRYWKPVTIDYDAFFEMYLDINNNYTQGNIKYLLNRMGWRVFWIYPPFISKFIFLKILRLKDILFKRK